jgi:hypothetical protein
MFILKDKKDIHLFKIHKLSKDLYNIKLNNIDVSNIIPKHFSDYKSILNKNLFSNISIKNKPNN